MADYLLGQAGLLQTNIILRMALSHVDFMKLFTYPWKVIPNVILLNATNIINTCAHMYTLVHFQPQLDITYQSKFNNITCQTALLYK